MKQDMQRCPNCSAYVMSNDDYCPRCDHRLDEPPPESHDPDTVPDSVTELALPAADAAEESDRADQITAVIDGEEMVVSQPSGNQPDSTDDEPESGGASTSPASGEATSPSAPPAEADQTPRSATQFPRAVPIFAEPDAPNDAPDDEDTAEQARPPDVPESMGAPDSTRKTPVENDRASVIDEPEPEPDLGDDLDDDSPPIIEVTESSIDLDPVPDSDPMDLTHPAVRLQSQRYAGRYIVPPAPYTRPPYLASPGYAAPPPTPPLAFLQQRVEDYRRAGYRLHDHQPDEVVLTYGKGLGVGGWVLALISVIGLLWYWLLLVLSGFQRDSVYIVLESDGFVYEDGPGAAHVRRQRSRVGRRWATFGLVIFFVCLLLAIVLGIVAGVVLTQERYQAALREAYPAVTLFEEQFTATEAAPDDVQLAKDGAVAFSILGGIALVGLWGGATLFVIGSIHASAYQVRVKALPGWE